MEHFEKIKCKHCDKESYFGIVILLHVMLKHKIKVTKKDIKFCFKYGVMGTIIHNILFIILFLIKLICLPFYIIYEKL